MITQGTYESRTAPSDGRGWSFVGQFHSAVGPASAVAISPHHILTASANVPHGHTGDKITFTLDGTSFDVGASVPITPDVLLYRVNGTLPTYAPLYLRTDELNQQACLVGCGETNGEAVITNGVQNGWRWGIKTKSWGMSCIDAVNDEPPLLRLGCCDFRGRHCATPAEHDLGGGAFIHDGPNWKLAGLITRIDPEDYKTPSGQLVHAGIFVATNLLPQRIQDTFALRISSVATQIKKASESPH